MYFDLKKKTPRRDGGVPEANRPGLLGNFSRPGEFLSSQVERDPIFAEEVRMVVGIVICTTIYSTCDVKRKDKISFTR
jgi:hypothetical protein